MKTHRHTNSSHIEVSNYDETTHTLTVKFNDGSVYSYQGVPESAYVGLIDAPSAGTYLNAKIKGKFKAQREGRLSA